MRLSLLPLLLCFFMILAGCVARDANGVLQPPIIQPPVYETGTWQNEPTETQQELSYSEETQLDPVDPAQDTYSQSEQQVQTAEGSFATQQQELGPEFRPRPKKTYLINGLASSVESIGYGFTNLSKKIPGSVLHNYASFVESSTIIRSRVTRELKTAYRRDPTTEINLIGISFGANIVTLIAADLGRSGIPVNYLVTMEGPAMVPINKNVKTADNFSCTNLDCFRTKSRLAWGNRETEFATFKIKTSHIPLANHPQVHARILSQINRRPPPLIVTQ